MRRSSATQRASVRDVEGRFQHRLHYTGCALSVGDATGVGAGAPESPQSQERAGGAEYVSTVADPENWAEYLGEYKPVVIVQARPQLREGFWSAFGTRTRGVPRNLRGARESRLSHGLYRMELLCGGKSWSRFIPGRVTS